MKKLIILFLLAPLIGCDRYEYDTTVEGVVVNRGSREPLDGVLVVLQDGVASSFWGGSPEGNTASDRKSEVYTDEQGRFKISLKGYHSAMLRAGGKDGYSSPKVEGRDVLGVWTSFPDGEHSNTVVTLNADAWFKGVLYCPDVDTEDYVHIVAFGGGGGVLANRVEALIVFMIIAT